MLEIFEVNDDNIKEVAKATGRRESDIASCLAEAKATNKSYKIWIDRPDNIPQDFMHSSH